MKFVKVGSLDPWIAVLAYRSIALVVSDHENHVGLASKRQILGNQSKAGHEKRKGEKGGNLHKVVRWLGG